MMLEIVLFAEEPARPAEPGFGGIPLPFLMIAMFAVFYLVVMLPAQRRQKREQAQMLANIKPGAKVFLSSGIIGRITKFKEGEDELTIQSEDSKFRVLRTSVVKVLGEETSETKPAA